MSLSSDSTARGLLAEVVALLRPSENPDYRQPSDGSEVLTTPSWLHDAPSSQSRRMSGMPPLQHPKPLALLCLSSAHLLQGVKAASGAMSNPHCWSAQSGLKYLMCMHC